MIMLLYGVTGTDFYSQSASLLFTIVTVLAILEVSSLHSSSCIMPVNVL